MKNCNRTVYNIKFKGKENRMKFPNFRAGTVLNAIEGTVKTKVNPRLKEIELFYPCRLDAMAINPAGVVYNEQLKFTPGEVAISIALGIYVRIKVLSDNGDNILISETSKRKVLISHACRIMFKALNVFPSIEVDVRDDNVLKHCGFGSSTATISAVAVAINEIYGKPISTQLLARYLANNHGEEICDSNEEFLKSVQSIGGSACSGMNNGGIFVIAGNATVIAKMKYKADVLIAIPKDFKEKDASLLMDLEEQNLWKFKKTGDLYKDSIAYFILHKALPDMINQDLTGLSNIVFDYRFNMGSIENCDFTYEGLGQLANSIKSLYLDKHCNMLSLSSVGPAFFVVTKNKKDKDYCIKYLKSKNFNIRETHIFNTKYKIIEKKVWDEK